MIHFTSYDHWLPNTISLCSISFNKHVVRRRRPRRRRSDRRMVCLLYVSTDMTVNESLNVLVVNSFIRFHRMRSECSRFIYMFLIFSFLSFVFELITNYNNAFCELSRCTSFCIVVHTVYSCALRFLLIKENIACKG